MTVSSPKARVAKGTWAFLGAPGIALTLLAVPGPCTTFNDVSDEPACEGGVAFAFYDDAGADASPVCQDLLNSQCCSAESACNRDPACSAWVSCVNQCATPRIETSACVKACSRDAAIPGPILPLDECFYDGGAESGAAQCHYLESN